MHHKLTYIHEVIVVKRLVVFSILVNCMKVNDKLRQIKNESAK